MTRLNWRPVYDIEQRTRLIEIETEQLKKENARLKKLNSKLDLLLRNPDAYLQMYPPTDSN